LPGVTQGIFIAGTVAQLICPLRSRGETPLGGLETKSGDEVSQKYNQCGDIFLQFLTAETIKI